MNPQVKVGQVWESTDPRDKNRRMKVISFSPRYAYMKNLATGLNTRIRLDRLRPTLGKRGYKLISDSRNFGFHLDGS